MEPSRSGEDAMNDNVYPIRRPDFGKARRLAEAFNYGTVMVSDSIMAIKDHYGSYIALAEYNREKGSKVYVCDEGIDVLGDIRAIFPPLKGA